jgi:signal transduction histidine kinase
VTIDADSVGPGNDRREQSITTIPTSVPTSASPVPPRPVLPAAPPPAFRRLYRRAEGRRVAGIAAGIAEHLQVPVFAVRLAFLVLLIVNGLGAILYAVFWALLDIDPVDKARGKSSRHLGQLFAFVAAAVLVQIVLAIAGLPGQYLLIWFLGVVAVGAALLWRRADDGQRQRWTAVAPRYPWLAMILARDRTATTVRIVGGGLLVLVGLIGFLAATGELSAIRDGLLFGGALLVGAAIVVAPWLWQIGNDLRDERTERIRSQERAEIAAIVHDQVLHTLALIQRKSDDSREVVRLARSQERELRNWLYKPTASPTEKIGAALEAVAAEVEDTYAVSVDAVVVGDCDVDDRLLPLVHAAREALVNAGRHAQVATVSLYAEVEPEQVSVFVRDRGAGFDLSTVDGDRHGVRGSILARMKRHGGKAEIRSAPGEGTEVRLTMQRGAAT